MNSIEKYFYGKDDVKIFYYEDIPSKAPAIILMAHGYMEHGGRYLELAEHMVNQGFGVCVLDQRGNGHSEGEKGDIEDFFDFVEDIYCLISELSSHHKPIITFGHSMGGLITFLYGLKYAQTVYGQIFSSPALGMPLGWHEVPVHFLESIGYWLKDKRMPRIGEILSTRNRTYLEAFKDDTLVNDSATFRFLDQFLRIGITYAEEHVGEYNLPCLFLLGEKDYVIPIKRNEEMIAKLDEKQVTVFKYPQCMHDLFHDMPEDVAHIVADMENWMRMILEKTNN